MTFAVSLYSKMLNRINLIAQIENILSGRLYNDEQAQFSCLIATIYRMLNLNFKRFLSLAVYDKKLWLYSILQLKVLNKDLFGFYLTCI